MRVATGAADGVAGLVVEDKAALMKKLGRKQLTVELAEPLSAVPEALSGFRLQLGNGGQSRLVRLPRDHPR